MKNPETVILTNSLSNANTILLFTGEKKGQIYKILDRNYEKREIDKLLSIRFLNMFESDKDGRYSFLF